MSISNDKLAKVVPYVPGLSIEYVAKKYNIPLEKVVKLASAENPYGPSPLALDAVNEYTNFLNLYPEWTALELRNKVSDKYNVPEDSVVCGVGITELVSLILRAFVQDTEEVLMFEPTFPLYHLICESEGHKHRFVSAKEEFDFSVDNLFPSIGPRTKVVILTSPHNPTGKITPLEEIQKLCKKAPNTLVVLDEAYTHFSRQPSGFELLKDNPNLVVLRTFSKVYGLASLRVGFAVTSSLLAGLLIKLKPTWNLGWLQIKGAVAALDDAQHLEKTISTIELMRDYVTERINSTRSFRVVEGSCANFVLVRIISSSLNSTYVFEHLLTRGVIVKDGSVSYKGLGDRFLRVDVSLRDYMDRFLEALLEIDVPNFSK